MDDYTNRLLSSGREQNKENLNFLSLVISWKRLFTVNISSQNLIIVAMFSLTCSPAYLLSTVVQCYTYYYELVACSHENIEHDTSTKRKIL